MKKLIKRLLGIDKLEENLAVLKQMEADALARTAEAQNAEKDAVESERIAKLTPKENPKSLYNNQL